MSQEKVTVKLGKLEKKYTLQHPGVEWFYQNADECATASGVPHQRKTCESYLEHVVVSPKKSISDFDEYKGKTKKVTVGENEYTIKHPGIVKTMDLYNDCRPNGKLSMFLEKKWYLDNVVQGDKKLDEFDSVSEVDDLMDECATLIMDEYYIHLMQLCMECDRFLTR